MKPTLRTKSVGTKVNEAEFALLKERARSWGLTLSEWVRDPLLAAPVDVGPDMNEVGSPSYFNKDNGILGNKSNADASAYRGRGYIQITGKSNDQQW